MPKLGSEQGCCGAHKYVLHGTALDLDGDQHYLWVMSSHRKLWWPKGATLPSALKQHEVEVFRRHLPCAEVCGLVSTLHQYMCATQGTRLV